MAISTLDEKNSQINFLRILEETEYFMRRFLKNTIPMVGPREPETAWLHARAEMQAVSGSIEFKRQSARKVCYDVRQINAG